MRMLLVLLHVKRRISDATPIQRRGLYHATLEGDPVLGRSCQAGFGTPTALWMVSLWSPQPTPRPGAEPGGWLSSQPEVPALVEASRAGLRLHCTADASRRGSCPSPGPKHAREDGVNVSRAGCPTQAFLPSSHGCLTLIS
jgi:hypothetical protein